MTNDAHGAAQTEIDSKIGLTALSVCYAAAAASTYVMPIIASAIGEKLGFRTEDLGYVLAVELAAMMLGAFLIYPRIGLKHGRAALGLSMIAIIVTNSVSAWVTQGTPFIALRSLAGLAEGVAQAYILAAAARSRLPEHAFTVIYTFLTFVLAAVFLGLPEIMGRWGYQSALIVLAGLGAVGLGFAPLIRTTKATLLLQTLPKEWTLGHSFVLGAWLMFIVGQYALFIYAERIADHIGISFEETSFIFAIGSVITIAAPWVAGWSMQRFGLTGSIISATLLSAASIIAFPFAPNAIIFGAVFLAFNCAMFYAFPVVSTLSARMDASGRLPSLLPAAQALGMVLGPIIASAILGVIDSYVALVIVSGVVTLMALGSAWPAARIDKAGLQGVPAEADRI